MENFVAFQIKTNIKDCFKTKSSWFESALIFAMLTQLLLLLFYVKFGFVLLLLVLPYLVVIEKKVLISKTGKDRLTWRDFVFSARRYGRCFCVFVAKILGGLFIYPLLSLTFSSFVLCDCKDLDFKGVLLLSNELSKGKKIKIMLYFLTIISILLCMIEILFLFLQLIDAFCFVPINVYWIVMLSGLSFGIACFVFPMWRKFCEKLYLLQKTETIRK